MRAATKRRSNAATEDRGTPRSHSGPWPCRPWPSLRPSAFTLIEMLVSLAVMALALSVVGVVFTITTRTTSQTAAYSEVHNWVRQCMEQIKEDLRYCNPSESVLVLVGRTQAAALTQNDLEAGKFYRVLTGNKNASSLGGYDPETAAGLDNADWRLAQYSNPRADILMFFSNRPTASQAPNPSDDANDPYAAGVRFAPIRVVYGHAALGNAVWTSAKTWSFPTTVRHIEQTLSGGQSVIPANRWHLARVATIIEPSAGQTQLSANACANVPLGRPYIDGTVYMPGDAAFLDLPYLAHTALGPTNAVFGGTIPPLLSPYGALTSILPTINSLIYSSGTTTPPPLHHVATVLEDVPVELRGNMGVHLLPGCAWFQVEFLMPEDARNSMTFSDPKLSGAYSTRTDMPRWTTVPAASTYVFVPDTPQNRLAVVDPAQLAGASTRVWDFSRLDQTPANDPNDVVSNRVVRMWPYAIRVTIRAYDPRGRLTEPIVRSIVHRFE